MNRRKILKIVASLGISSIAGAAWAQSEVVRVRRALSDPRSKSDVEAFAMAVEKMRGLTDASNPLSWNYWANVHGVTGSIPAQFQNIWSTCDHGAYFLAWHRMYLSFFEAVIAKVSGKADFAMPYWNWYVNLDLPKPFAMPGDTANALWQPKRGFAVRYKVTTAVLSNSSYITFNQRAFSDPHSNIHLNFSGDMADPATAARDPIFWPHHAAMDRLWEIWRATEGHRNPLPGDKWFDQTFSFSTSGPGAHVSIKDMLVLSQLGYTYDDLVLQTQEARMPPRPANVEVGSAKALTEAVASPNATVTITERKKMQLDGTSKTVRLTISQANPSRLESIGSVLPKASSLTLVLDGVQLTAAGRKEGALYEIYINLPTTSQSEAVSSASASHYVGQINSFGLRSHGKHASHGHQKMRIVLELDQLVPLLRTRGSWSPDQLEINFVEPSERPASSALITIDSIQIRLGPKTP